ncbi:UNVERIFIED_CONTAM: hypothetical protein Scaly_0593100 [Sesamum calycinum]|uniref:Reverse transcriptase domain-containing protein n=1 Tax=Sesamum calycinum TaxID=2727403 RepID=A0AAW2RUB1_9LAMI
MKHQTTLTVSCGRVLKAKAKIMIFTQVHEDDNKSVASSNYISNDAEEDIAQTYHITLIEDGEIEEEDAEDAPAELEEDATMGHEALSFMDGLSGYNQICMAPEDEKLTAFRTPKVIYCYKVMPFRLKNVGATYQKAIQRIFNDMLQKNAFTLQCSSSSVPPAREEPSFLDLGAEKYLDNILGEVEAEMRNPPPKAATDSVLGDVSNEGVQQPKE